MDVGCMCLYTTCIQCHQRPEEGSRSWETGVTNDGELPTKGVLRIEPSSSWRGTSMLNHWVNSPYFIFLFKHLFFYKLFLQPRGVGGTLKIIYMLTYNKIYTNTKIWNDTYMPSQFLYLKKDLSRSSCFSLPSPEITSIHYQA